MFPSAMVEEVMTHCCLFSLFFLFLDACVRSGGLEQVSQLSSLPAIHGGGRENLGENQVYLPDIVGKDRNKFFGRPLVPYMQAMEAPPDV